MKKFSLICVAIAMAAAASAQDAPDTGIQLDAREDTTNVVTIADIIAVQEMVTSHNSSDAHYNSVWSRQTYFNLAYNTKMTLSPEKHDICAGLSETQYVQPFKADWGASLTLGHNYRLHKKAIANTLQFNIDWSYINLHINHFKAGEPNADGKLFNSNLTWEYYDEEERTTDTYHYLPWNMEKYEFSYGMELGPSITIAPFNYINVAGLHYFKLNIYYHWGYQVSMMLITNDKKLDANIEKNTANYKEMNGSSKQTWASGLTGTFGFSINWKSIGFGWETRTSDLKYQSMQKELFGSNKYKFNAETNRIYLQIRY